MRSRVIGLSTLGVAVALLAVHAAPVAHAEGPRRPAFRVAPSVNKVLVRRPADTRLSNLPSKKPPLEDGASGRPGRDTGSKPPRQPDGATRPPNRGDDVKPPRKRPPVVVVVVPPVIVEVPPRQRPRVPKPRVVVDNPPPMLARPLPPGVRPSSPPVIIPLAPLVPPPLPPLASPPQIVPAFLPDEVLITVATAALPQLEADVAQAFNVTIIERTPLPLIDARLVRMRIPDGRAVPQLVALLASDPRVFAAQPNYLYRHNNEPTPRLEAAAAAAAAPATLQYALGKVGAADIHRVARGRGARIAVLDSGVDATHPDFGGADIAHFDATDDPRASAADYDTHGTGIAGIISGRGTVQGLAPGATLASARVFRKSVYGSSATTAFVIKGITWSAETGARILNMSFAGPRDPLVERHLKVTAARGMIAVAAAGNFGAAAAPAYPAAYEGVIAVTAIDANDRLYSRANQGSYVAVAAPGVDVIVPAVGRSHHFQSGTSFAAAHVSGVAALLLELDASLSPAALRDILVSAADDLGPVGPDPAFGAGRINVSRSAERAQRASARP